MEAIQIVGLEKLEKSEKDAVKLLVGEHFTKIQRHLKDIDAIILNIKEYNKEGKRKKFSLHLRAMAPVHIFEADAADWDLRRTVHKVFEKLENELEHHFHSSDQHKHSSSRVSKVFSWFGRKK